MGGFSLDSFLWSAFLIGMIVFLVIYHFFVDRTPKDQDSDKRS